MHSEFSVLSLNSGKGLSIPDCLNSGKVMLSLVLAYLNPPRNKVSPLSVFYSLFSVRGFEEAGNTLALAHLPAWCVVLQTLL